MATDQDFATAIAFVLEAETGGDPTGALHQDPNDPGGLTKWGISQREYPTLDIAELSEADAEQLYYRDYWIPSGAPSLPMPLAEVQFDTYVNMQPRVAQQILADSGGDVAKYLALRAQAYQTIAANNPKLAGFLGGWLQRLADLSQAIAPATVAGGAAVGILLAVAIAILAYRAKHPPRPK